jgi:hypothetical protein
MGVVTWRTRACTDLKCGKVFVSKEVREDLETFAKTIVNAIISHEFLTHANKLDPGKTCIWESIVKRVLREYRDE